MHKLISILTILFFLTSTTLSSSNPPPNLPFTFTPLFTGHLTVGKPLPRIATAGGALVAEPIANGTVTGPAINATISGGIATPSVYNTSSGAVQVPVIRAWGITEDGYGVVINEMGIGKPAGQVTRIEIDVGGGTKYDILRNSFVLASVNPNQEETEVFVRGYAVENSGMFEE